MRYGVKLKLEVILKQLWELARYKSLAADENELQELYTVISQAAKRQVLVIRDFNFPKISIGILI
jgi:hypothetical protein